MPRADLLLQLVQAGGKSDKVLFKRVAEAIIAEEKSKQHNILAEKLQEALNLMSIFPSPKNHLINGNIKLNEGGGLVDEISPSLRLEDLILNEITRKTIADFIEEQLRADLLRSYNIEPRNKIMLIGPPGNGKTSLAEAIANSLTVPLLSVKYESIITSYLGETSSRLKTLFDYVRTQNCVLFFDEFDSIGKERGDIHETGEIKRVVSSLLLQIDKLPSYVTIVAATNHPELLDKAVWRRFQIKTQLLKPNIKEIELYITNYQKKFELNFGHSSSFLADNLKELSYSELKDFCEDIIRKYILSLPDSSKTLKSITADTISGIRSAYNPKN